MMGRKGEGGRERGHNGLSWAIGVMCVVFRYVIFQITNVYYTVLFYLFFRNINVYPMIRIKIESA